MIAPRRLLVPGSDILAVVLRLMTASLVLSALAASLSHAQLESGKPIRLGVGEGLGPLAAGLSSYPVGVANVYGSTHPDLFVVAGKFSFPPGLFLYRRLGSAPDGTPVFGERIPVRHPSSDPSPECFILQEGSLVHGLFREERSLIHAVFVKEKREFVRRATLSLSSLPRSPGAFAMMRNPDGSLELLFHISDGTQYRSPEINWRDPRYIPYDGAGIWIGGLPYMGLYASSRRDLASGAVDAPKLASKFERDVLWGNHSLTIAKLGPGRDRDIVAGSRFGNLFYYRNASRVGLTLDERRHIVGEDGNALRHPTVNPSPIAYPNARTGLSDLIAGGEGALYYYRYAGRFNREGKPVYLSPVPLVERGAGLYSGSLGVPTQVDWDGDGVVDLVCGNSEGVVLFFRNAGRNEAPAFLPGVPLRAGGDIIHVQPGYKGDIQGPAESRWGYVSPNVVDWNGDGLPDILMGDSLARHMVYLNRGTRSYPALARAQPLYLDGLDLHGTWRVRPGVARLGNRMAYVANDDQDEFHLYWRVDDYNVADGGKLRMGDGSAIRANFWAAGGTGRSKLELVDWDGDGLIDLMVGTPRHHSVPNAETGLPKALGLPGATVLFLKNVNTNDAPRFRFPTVLKHRGEPIYLGTHEITVAAGLLGGGKGPNLVVSREDGRVIFYKREFLTPGGP